MSKDTPFKWSDNTPVAYTAWQTGEPNAGYRSYQYTRCGHTVNGTERWNDHYCYSKKGYVCKFKKCKIKSLILVSFYTAVSFAARKFR